MRFLYTFMEIYKENTFFFIYAHGYAKETRFSFYIFMYLCSVLSVERAPCFITFSQDSEKKRQFFPSKATTKRTGCVVSLLHTINVSV